MAASLVLAAWIGSAAAAQPALPQTGPSRSAVELERFLNSVQGLCQRAPARRCIDAAFAYADLNRDGRLSVDELARVRAAVGDWLTWRGGTLSADEQNQAAFGIMIVDTLGIPAIVQSYDQDRDGALTEREMLADVRLDRRPLPVLLADPNSVDRVALQQRLGVMGAMTDNIFPQ